MAAVRIGGRSCSRLAESSNSSAFPRLRSVLSCMTRASKHLSGSAFSAGSKPRSGNARSSSVAASAGRSLAALLLRRDEVVPVERLLDEVWGDDPPASAAHSLESYVSRLRRALSPYGVTVERRGGGYRIDRGGAVLDSQVFEELVEQAAQALAADDHVRAASIATEALGLWHGPVLAGLTLHLDGRAEAERLDELRSRAFEIRIDADLALGRHAELVGELHRLVE